MTALTDAEILAALPIESREKIDNAFESLTQALPSPTEKVTLYRVLHTLKLNPTDTVFSVVSALHLYLQLYRTIPDKIAKAGGEIRQAGADVDAAIRKTTHETLTEHAGALKAQAELVAVQNQQALIRDVGKIAQRIAGNTAAAERHKSFYQAAGVLTAFAIVFFGAGMAIGTHEIGLLALSAICLGIGVIAGMVLCQAMIAGEQRHAAPQRQSEVRWTEVGLQQTLATIRPAIEGRAQAACRDVLLNGELVGTAALKQKLDIGQVERAIGRIAIQY